MARKLTTEEFIRKAREVHGDKYDYSKVEYVNNRTPVCIICPIHGEFWQSPDSHLVGKGCKNCGRKKISDKKLKDSEDFIRRGKEIHGDKYDYSKVEYKGNKTKVCIICKTCGKEFWISPVNHCSKHNQIGCPYCHGGKFKEEFIQKAREVHGNKYDYSKVEYVDARTPVIIGCPIHGDFKQTPESHVHGKGCHRCMGKGAFKHTKEDFIQKAREVHGDKYDYSKVEYVNAHTKVCIICPEHGEFWQTPTGHLVGGGCKECTTFKSEKIVGDFLKNKAIKIIRWKTFEWLGRMNIDIFLPDYNIGIEYQGEEHFKPVKHFGGDERFKKRIEADKKKLDLCNKNGVRLLYVSFYKDPTYEVINDLDDLYEIILGYEN